MPRERAHSNHPRGDIGAPGTGWRPSTGAAQRTALAITRRTSRVVVDRIVLVAGAEVEDPPAPARPAAAAAEHLAARERADEHQLVGRRDVEVLAVHLLRVDDDRLRHAGGDRMRGGDRPHQLALALVAPAQAARRAEQALEDLGVVAGVQDDEPHAAEHRLVHAVDDRVVDLVVGGVPPPGQHVGGVEHLGRQSVLVLLERRRPHGPEVGERRGERAVDTVGVDRAHVILRALVHVLVPDRHVHACSMSITTAAARRHPRRRARRGRRAGRRGAGTCERGCLTCDAVRVGA